MSRCDSRVFLGFGYPANRTRTGGGEKQCTVGPLRSSGLGRHRSRSGPRAGGVAPRSRLSRARPGTGPRRRTGHYSEIARGSLLRSPRKAGCTRPWRTAGGSRQSVTCVSLLLRKGSSDKMHSSWWFLCLSLWHKRVGLSGKPGGAVCAASTRVRGCLSARGSTATTTSCGEGGYRRASAERR